MPVQTRRVGAPASPHGHLRWGPRAPRSLPLFPLLPSPPAALTICRIPGSANMSQPKQRYLRKYFENKLGHLPPPTPHPTSFQQKISQLASHRGHMGLAAGAWCPSGPGLGPAAAGLRTATPPEARGRKLGPVGKGKAASRGWRKNRNPLDPVLFCSRGAVLLLCTCLVPGPGDRAPGGHSCGSSRHCALRTFRACARVLTGSS